MRPSSVGYRAWSLLLIALIALAGSSTAFAQGGAVQGFTATSLTPDNTIVSTQLKEGVPRTTDAPVTDDNMVGLLVKLDVDPLASYEGDIAGLPATSPRKTGRKKVDPAAPESRRYLQHVQRKQREFEARAKARVPGARVATDFSYVFGGVSMIVPVDKVAEIAALPEVVSILPDELRQLDTEVSPRFIGADTIWNQLGGQGSAGEGVIVGVLDSGIWPEHPSFSDPDPLGKPYAAPPPTLGAPRACEFSGGANPGAAFTCNNKLIGADRFMATYDAIVGVLPTEFTSARDDNGHGNHTATTAAGNAGVAASIFGVSRGTISGVAPRAHVMAYKVCGDQGCFNSDSVAAINQAIKDGVDVINFSISGGGNPYADAVELAFLDAYNAGVFVAASAGNSGPTPETVAHRGPWVTTVGASTSDRHFLSNVTLTGDNGDSIALVGATVTDGIAPTDLVNAADAPYNDRYCLKATADGAFAGKVVVCERGGDIGRILKGFNVKQRGAVGMLLYNPTLQGLNTDNHYLPAVHIENDEGARLLAFLASHTGEKASWTPGSASEVQGDVMAAFSSRGGPGQTLGISKPDITAPGVQILAGNTPAPATAATGGQPAGELFQAIQGTSMSSPHVAGAGALLAALHPRWTPGQIKSAMMTTALTEGLVQEDGETPFTPFDAGSGRVDLNVAGNPGITFDVPAVDYVRYRNDLWNANYPSLYLPVMAGVMSVQRVAHSELSRWSNWRISVVGKPDDLRIFVPGSIWVPPGGDKAFQITVDAHAVPIGEVRHATILLTSGSMRAHLPVTIVRKQAAVTLDKRCSPATIVRGNTTRCTIALTNTTFDPATVNVADFLPRELRLVPSSVVNATPLGNGIVFNGPLAPAQPPNVGMEAGATPAGGYLGLSAFGVAPIAGMGDETAANFTVPAFTFAGETWTTIGMTSNGYAVVGGANGAADIQFINQSLPNPTPPNNVLAPFWSDLNPALGGAMRIGQLASGGKSWIVLEWEAVREYSQPRVNSFQIWIGLNGVQDITYGYGAIGGNGDGGLLTVGTENKFGNRGANVYFNGAGALPANGTQLRVTSTPGAPGETRTITFNATGNRVGQWTNCAGMTTNITVGLITSCFDGEVTR